MIDSRRSNRSHRYSGCQSNPPGYPFLHDVIHAFIKVNRNIDIAQRLCITFRQSAEQVCKNYVFSFFQILAGVLDTIRNIFWQFGMSDHFLWDTDERGLTRIGKNLSASLIPKQGVIRVYPRKSIYSLPDLSVLSAALREICFVPVSIPIGLGPI
jgi:hypothetical protein